ncbi:MAG: hypothetical protein JKY94_14540 [Rhodobacteraceae bacterium]|nr:hypothetical protein [Paracoccaceae bacterium]
MSDTDSFIDEVNDEVRRDRMFMMLKRYGWIAVLIILMIVGGAAWSEYQKAQVIAQSEELGDAIIAALASNDTTERASALSEVSAQTPAGAAIVQLLVSAAQANSDQSEAAVTGLNTIADNGELQEIYRQIAAFKALTLQSDTLPAADLRLQFEALAIPGAPLRLLAMEQLALVDIAEGQVEPAIAQLQDILQDADAGRDLQQRVSQLIVALGGTPEFLPGAQG